MYEEISVLSINGSDSTARAGLQADARTITALGGFALTAVTSVTHKAARASAACMTCLPGWLRDR